MTVPMKQSQRASRTEHKTEVQESGVRGPAESSQCQQRVVNAL